MKISLKDTSKKKIYNLEGLPATKIWAKLLAYYFNLSEEQLLNDFCSDKNEELYIPITDWKKFADFTGLIRKRIPYQYILGYTYFLGMKIHVNKDVLVPRPETEELVNLVAKENITNQTILDLGTGSGCIPIWLAKQYPNTEVYGLDISQEAINVAVENAKEHDVEITFIENDWLEYFEGLDLPLIDILISNPPYVEKDFVLDQIASNEPIIALKGNKDNYFDYYLEIFSNLKNILTPDTGKAFLEINPNDVDKIKEALNNNQLKHYHFEKDLQQKTRFLIIWNK